MPKGCAARRTALTRSAALNLVNRGLGRDAQACGARRLRQGPGGGVAEVRDQLDFDPRVFQVERGAIGAVVRGDDDDALADFDAILDADSAAPRRPA